METTIPKTTDCSSLRMKMTDSLLQDIAYSITSNEYVWTDPEKTAITDNCHIAGDCANVFINANALLNTKGGTIIIGILDDESSKRYIFTAFDPRNDEKLKLIPYSFTDADGEPADLSEYFDFELSPFLTGNVLVIYVYPTGSQNKYYYKGIAYERLASGNNKRLFPTADATGAEIASVADAIDAETIEAVEKDPGNNAPAAMKLYSTELITLFGADYISLEPDFKELLAFIYEWNLNEREAIKPEEICYRLWTMKGIPNTPAEYALYVMKMKKALTRLEKDGLLLQGNRKQQHLLNKNYTASTNLFS